MNSSVIQLSSVAAAGKCMFFLRRDGGRPVLVRMERVVTKTGTQESGAPEPKKQLYLTLASYVSP